LDPALSPHVEVPSILHLLDMPDAALDDPDTTARIYQTLRSVRDRLEVITDVARDRRLFLLEATVVLLILLEIVMSLVLH
jgi:hypothetical protein